MSLTCLPYDPDYEHLLVEIHALLYGLGADDDGVQLLPARSHHNYDMIDEAAATVDGGHNEESLRLRQG